MVLSAHTLLNEISNLNSLTQFYRHIACNYAQAHYYSFQVHLRKATAGTHLAGVYAGLVSISGEHSLSLLCVASKTVNC